MSGRPDLALRATTISDTANPTRNDRAGTVKLRWRFGRPTLPVIRPGALSGDLLSAGYGRQANHLSPRAAPFRQELSSSWRRVAIAAGSEVISYRTERPEKALRLLS